MSVENTKTYAIIHIVSEALVAIGFLIGIIPLAFWASMYWVIPLVVVNVIISIVAQDKTLPYTITNLVLAVISVIPIIGSVTALAGVIMSILSVVECASILNPNLAKSLSSSVEPAVSSAKKTVEDISATLLPTKKVISSKAKPSKKISSNTSSSEITEITLETKLESKKPTKSTEKKKQVTSKKTVATKPSSAKPKKSL